ncbi:MAG: SPOR domain-containing protein [Clostridium sp.]|nr:SPOR domain-containing protein [Clostridium sp.]
MRYTRYNYKKNKNNNLVMFIFKLVGTVVSAGICGIALAYVAFSVLTKNDVISGISTGNENPIQVNSNDVTNSKKGSNMISSNTTVFYTVQCGYFSNENNAKQILSSINGKYSAFIYESEDKFRVISGIYESDKVEQIVNELKSRNIDCAKIRFSFNNDDKVEYQIASICDGYIRLLDTAFSDDVKSINTDDFKDWTNKLENVSEGEKIDILNNLKQHIADLTSEINKENVATEMEYIYTVLVNFKDI